MPAILTVLVNQVNETPVGGAAGQTIGLPTSRIIIQPAPAGKVVNTVTMLTSIRVVSSGTRVASDLWLSPTATATVIAAAG